jgi:hypothetical protein
MRLASAFAQSLLLPSILLLSAATSLSQTLTQTIRGIILDADSKAPIEQVGVKILNLDTNIYCTSDIAGKFKLLKVPVGRLGIKFSFVGYEEVILQNIIVTTGKEIVLNVEMHEKLFIGNEVVIIAHKDKTKANNELVTNSSRNFQSEETERYAGSRGDPAKMAANYAGVATGNDARNDIIVRGNSPLGVLWRLENTDIPSPNHFSTQGATGGAISILNNSLLASSDFLTGAFPSEFGNKMAAVFDLKLRNGNNEKMEFTTQFGLNGLEGGVEGPISPKNGSSFLVNYRYSTLKLFQLAGIKIGVSALPQYQDLTFKINIPTEKAGVFSIWGIGGMSKIAILDSEKDSTDWNFTSSGEDLIFGSKMGVAGLSHLYFFTDKISGKLNLSVSGTMFDVTIDTLSADRKSYRTFTNDSKDGHYFANYTITNKVNSHHLLKAGITAKNTFFNYHSYFWSRNNNRYLDQFNDKNNTSNIQSFIHWQYKITDNFILNNGIHYNLFTISNAWAVEPRAGIRWQFSPKQSLSSSFGMHSQTLPTIYYFYTAFDSTSNTYSQTNKKIGLSKSRHYVLAYDNNFAQNFRFKLETYYQDLYNIPIEKYTKTSFSTINIGSELDGIRLMDSLENKGTGCNYGAEITLEKFFSKNYYFLNSFSLYNSQYKGSDRVLRHSAFSGGYVYSCLGGLEIPVLKKNQIIGLDVKFTFAGGNRYTPINLEQSILNKKPIYVDSLAFSEQYRNYQKIDFKISYRINKKQISHYIYINIENIFNHKNILQQVYNNKKQEMMYDYQLGIFPYGGYRLEF